MLFMLSVKTSQGGGAHREACHVITKFRKVVLSIENVELALSVFSRVHKRTLIVGKALQKIPLSTSQVKEASGEILMDSYRHTHTHHIDL